MGGIGFDDCHLERNFSGSEETILRSAGELIAGALIRNEMEEALYTSTKDLRRALTIAEAKSEFLSNMSHEMRTPLNAVIGMTAIGLRSAGAERKNYALERIKRRRRIRAAIEFIDAGKAQKERFYKYNTEKQIAKATSIKEGDYDMANTTFTVL